MTIRAEVLLGEAEDVQRRQLSPSRAAELATELAALMDASHRLGRQLRFDDQASDFVVALLDTREAAARGGSDQPA